MKPYALYALALFVFSIPFESGVLLPGIGSLARLIGIGAIGLAILSLFWNGRLWIRPPSLLLLVAFIYFVWAALSYFWSIERAATYSAIITLAQLVAMAWMIHQVASDERGRDVLAQAFVFGAYAAIAIALTAFLGSGGTAWRDVGAGDPNTFATVCAFAIPFAWALASRVRSPLLFWLNALYPVFAAISIVLAASRGGLLVTIVALLAIPLSQSKISPARRFLGVSVVALLAWGTYAYGLQAFPALERNVDRLGDAATEIEEGTLTGRTIIWQSGMEAYMTSPIVGVGVGGFRYATEAFLGSRRGAHNTFLSVAVGLGFVGLTLFLSLIFIVAAGVLWTRQRRIEFALLLPMLIVGMIPLSLENHKSAWFILAWLSAARPFLIVGPMPTQRTLGVPALVASAMEDSFAGSPLTRGHVRPQRPTRAEY